MKLKKYLCLTVSKMSLFFLVFGVLMAMMSGTVCAQEGEYTLEDTIVTATKTGETQLQVTPLSISVFDDEKLANISAFKLEDVAQFSPSVDLKQYFQSIAAYIRGIGTNSSGGANDHNVSFYVDGVYLHKGRGSLSDFIDVERIEVLKGPQGTLYGRDTTAGAINIITKKPSDHLEMTGSVEVGNYGKRRVNAMISGPLIKDKINARLTVSDSLHDAKLDNLTTRDLREENFHGFRGSIHIIPSDKVDILIRGDYLETDAAYMDTGKLISYGPVTDAAREALGVSKSDFVPEDFYTVNLDGDYWRREKGWGGSGELNIDFSENLSLKYLIGYRFQDADENYEFDGSILPWSLYRWPGRETDSWTQELTLNATWGRLKGLFGAFYFEGESLLPGHMHFSPMMGMDMLGNWTATTLAGFSQLQYAVSDKLTATAGIRYSYDEKTSSTIKDFFWVQDLPWPLPPRSLELEEGDWTAWTPKFALDYRATDDLFFYGLISKGYRSGVPMLGNELAGYPLVTDPEIMWTYEVGVKSDWLGKRLRVNAAVFYNDYTDYMVERFVLVPDFGYWMVMTNAGGAEITGVELEFVARPTQALTINGAVTYLDHEYVDFIAEDRWGEDHDVSGNPIDYALDLAFTLGADYVVPIEQVGFLTFGANMSWRDDTNTTPVIDPLLRIDDYAIVNVRVRFETEDEHWSLEAYGKNILESEHYRDVWSNSDQTAAHLGEPMTIGIIATYKY